MREHEKVGAIHKNPTAVKYWSDMSEDERIAQHIKARGCNHVEKGVIKGYDVYIGGSKDIVYGDEDYPEGYYLGFACIRWRTIKQFIHGQYSTKEWPELTHEDKFRYRMIDMLNQTTEAINIGLQGNADAK